MKQILLAIALIAIPVAAFTGFQVHAANTKTAGTPAGLGDLSPLKAIVADAQAMVAKGDLAAAANHMTDFESAWDQGQSSIRPLNPTYWGNIDAASDAALSAIREAKPSASNVKTTLDALMAALNDPGKAVP